MVDPESIPRLMAAGTIEVAPLAYMRGRTLNDAFVILDEAQNTTAEQMKMFLTRLGFGSKIVVTGDITQVDLPGGAQSGLRIVREILDGIDDVHFATLTSADVVRHRLVGDIVDAYERWDAARQPAPARPAPAPRCGRPDRAGRGADRARRGRQRVRDRRRRGRAGRRLPVRARRDGGQPDGRAVGALRRRRVHEQPARALDGGEGADRRPGLPDGRAGHRPSRRPRPGPGPARRRRPVPGRRRPAGPRRRALHGRRAGPAGHPRRAAPARATTTWSPTRRRRCSVSSRSCSTAGAPRRASPVTGDAGRREPGS